MIGQTPSTPEPRPDAASQAGGDSGQGQPGERREIGGRDGPEPTRYGDWEKNGRCIDF